MNIAAITTDSAGDFDWRATQLEDEREWTFVKCLDRGMTQWKAAEVAGFKSTSWGSMDEKARYDWLRKKGSMLANTRKITVALDLFRVWTGRHSQGPLNDAEIDKEIAKSVREPGNSSEKIQALRLAQDRQDRRGLVQQEENTNPVHLMRRLAVTGQSYSKQCLAELAFKSRIHPATLTCFSDCAAKANPSVQGSAFDLPACQCDNLLPSEISDELIDEYATAFARLRALDRGNDGPGPAAPSPRPGGVAADRGEAAGTGAGADGKAPANGSGTAGTNKPPLRNDAVASRIAHAFGEK